MTDDEITFDKFCIKHNLGPREDIENYPNVPAAPAYAYTKNVALDLIKKARERFPALLPIHFDFISDGSVNAYAFRIENKYFIGITSGAMAMLRLIHDRILANPSTFKNIGQPEEEDPNICPVPWKANNAEVLFDLGVRPKLPNNQDRSAYARHLADQAILFLIGHEIAHITRGHVDYLNASSGSSFISEPRTNGSQDRKMVRQAIEVDADHRSVISRCLSANITAIANGERHWSSIQPTKLNWQFDWAFSVNTFFRLFGDPRFSGRALNDASYPPISLRQKIAMQHAEIFLVKGFGEPQREYLKNMLSKCIIDTEFCFSAVGASPADGGLADAESPSAKEHIQNIKNCWDDIKDKVQQHSHENLS